MSAWRRWRECVCVGGRVSEWLHCAGRGDRESLARLMIYECFCLPHIAICELLRICCVGRERERERQRLRGQTNYTSAANLRKTIAAIGKHANSAQHTHTYSTAAAASLTQQKQTPITTTTATTTTVGSHSLHARERGRRRSSSSSGQRACVFVCRHALSAAASLPRTQAATLT